MNGKIAEEARQLRGKQYESEFYLNEELAVHAIRGADRKLNTKDTRYGLINGLYTEYIVAIDTKDRIAEAYPLFSSAPMPEAAPDYNGVLEQMEVSAKKSRILRYVGLVGTVIFVIAAYILLRVIR